MGERRERGESCLKYPNFMWCGNLNIQFKKYWYFDRKTGQVETKYYFYVPENLFHRTLGNNIMKDTGTLEWEHKKNIGYVNRKRWECIMMTGRHHISGYFILISISYYLMPSTILSIRQVKKFKIKFRIVPANCVFRAK